MARMKLGDLPETPEVEMWDTAYRVLPLTRSLQKKLLELADKHADLEKSEDPDEVAEALIQVLDVRLQNTNGSSTKPGTILRKKWKADEVTLEQLNAFADGLDEADDPT